MTLTTIQKQEILKGAKDWALTLGFNEERAVEYANEFLRIEMANPSFNDGQTTPFTK